MTDAPTDLQLLRRYAAERDDAAFALLAARHVDWVYSVARRTVRDEHLAEDVTQAAFILLARKAKKLAAAERTVVSAWLFAATRWVSAAALRSEGRRRRREGQAAIDAAARSSGGASESDDWEPVAAMLDELVARLRAEDRRAVLLRYYERKSFGEVGAALRVSEEAARKRVARAVKRLREMFARRGVTAPGTVDVPALAALLAARAVAPAPAGLAARAGSLVSGGTAASAGLPFTLANGGLNMMNLARIKTATAVVGSVAVLAAGGAVLVQHVLAGNVDVHVHSVTTAVLPGNQPAAPKQDDPKADKSVLDQKIPRVNFNGVTLKDAVEFLKDISGQKFDWKAMEDAGIKGDAVLKVDVQDATLGEAVKKIFQSAGAKEAPSVTLEDKKIVVKPAAKKEKDKKD